MVEVARVFTLALLGGALAACQTDGLTGPEVDAAAAKPRVIDTPKTRPLAAKKPVAPVPPRATAEGDTGSSAVVANNDQDVTGSIRDQTPAPAGSPGKSEQGPSIPAQSLFGNWTLGENGGARKCRLILGGVLIGAAYSARSEPDCPPALTSVQTWEIRGDELLLRGQRGVIGRLLPTGPFRFDGQVEGGPSVYLVR
jgi:hypothetical protein